jgi:hypothetical protein
MGNQLHSAEPTYPLSRGGPPKPKGQPGRAPGVASQCRCSAGQLAEQLPAGHPALTAPSAAQPSLRSPTHRATCHSSQMGTAQEEQHRPWGCPPGNTARPLELLSQSATQACAIRLITRASTAPIAARISVFHHAEVVHLLASGPPKALSIRLINRS